MTAQGSSQASLRNPTHRFSDRVEDYVRYRPHYSPDIVRALTTACGLRPEHVIADIGCGTGLLAKIFLENGNPVTGVEPNREMRQAGESFLADHRAFRMIDGAAESTGLPATFAHFVIAGQAFHWFQPHAARAEFARILKPGGWTVLIWHDRDTGSTAFLREYEAFLHRHAIDYAEVAHTHVSNYAALEQFFAPDKMSLITQQTAQHLGFDGLRGRLLSSSYVPREGEAADQMLGELPDLFAKHQRGGEVVMEYVTRIYFGHLHA